MVFFNCLSYILSFHGFSLVGKTEMETKTLKQILLAPGVEVVPKKVLKSPRCYCSSKFFLFVAVQVTFEISVHGSSIKYVRSDFVLLDPPLPPVRAHTLLTYNTSPPTRTSVRIVLFKEDMTDIFCELLSIKEPQTTLQNKETMYNAIGKCRIKTPKKSPRIKFALSICTGEIGMNNFGYLNSSLYFISIL